MGAPISRPLSSELSLTVRDERSDSGEARYKIVIALSNLRDEDLPQRLTFVRYFSKPHDVPVQNTIGLGLLFPEQVQDGEEIALWVIFVGDVEGGTPEGNYKRAEWALVIKLFAGDKSPREMWAGDS